MAELAIVTCNLTRRFGSASDGLLAVDGIDLRVGKGQFFGFLGPNGAGKSTTIRMLTGLLAPTAGRIEVLEHDLAQNPIEVKRQIGVVPEGLALFDRLTGPEYLNFAGRMYGLDRTTAARRTAELLEFTQLCDRARTYPVAIGYTLFAFMQHASNILAFEGRGIQLLLVAPSHFRSVILVKNLFYSAVIGGEAFLLWVELALIGMRPDGMVTLLTLSALPLVVLSQLSVGNLLSFYFPRRFDFGRFKQRPSPASLLVGIATQPVVMGVAYLVFLVGRRTGPLWMVSVVYLALGAMMITVYRSSLGHAARLAHRRREVPTNELCQD